MISKALKIYLLYQDFEKEFGVDNYYSKILDLAEPSILKIGLFVDTNDYKLGPEFFSTSNISVIKIEFNNVTKVEHLLKEIKKYREYLFLEEVKEYFAHLFKSQKLFEQFMKKYFMKIYLEVSDKGMSFMSINLPFVSKFYTKHQTKRSHDVSAYKIKAFI